MKKLSYALTLSTLLTILSSVGVYAQEVREAPAIKPKVVKSQVLFKKTLWRRMDLKERQNRPFFSINGEITKVILEAARKGIIFPYENDSCTTRMPLEEFESRITIEQTQGAVQEEADPNDPFAQLNQQNEQAAPTGPQWIPANDFDFIQIKEDLYFDRLRSRMYYDIQAITLYLPATSFYNTGGFNKQIASFKYSELERLFREVMPEKSIWYNNQNQAQHRNFADAFTLRLFSAPITKISNGSDKTVREIYGQGKKGVIAAQQLEHELLEFENELWEY